MLLEYRRNELTHHRETDGLPSFADKLNFGDCSLDQPEPKSIPSRLLHQLHDICGVRVSVVRWVWALNTPSHALEYAMSRRIG